METIRIAAWNANGLLQHVHTIEIFLLTEKIDICLISETHLTKENYINIKGYKFYHTVHPSDKARGGSGILIKEKIDHYEEPKFSEEAIQATSVNIKVTSRSYTVTAVYCPPKHRIDKDTWCNFLSSQGEYFIIGGDFNAKHTHWGSRLINPKGRSLYQAGGELHCDFYSTGKPTYWPSDPEKIPDLIDFFVARGVSSNYVHVEESVDLTSDHTPIILTLSDTIIIKQIPPRLTGKNTNWEQFRGELDNKINLRVPLKSPEQLENEVENFVKLIQEAAWNSTPELQRKSVVPTYPVQVREMVLEKRKARRKWQRIRTAENKAALNRISNALKQLLKEIKNQSFSSFLQELTDEKSTDYSLWKVSKNLKRPKNPEPPIRNENGTWSRSSREKADMFAEHLYHTFQPYDRQTADEDITHRMKYDDLVINLVTLTELKGIISNLSTKKTPGYDLITGYVLKQLPRRGAMKLLHLINASLRLQFVPRQWKVAEVIMVPKSGKPVNEKTSYRPISLLPVISKVFEKLLLSRLKPIIDDRNLIPEHQFGFRNNYSTLDQVHRITNVIEDALETKRVCTTVFLDVAQAFDKVWHKGLLFKLHRDLPEQYYKILQSYLSERHFRVRHEDEFSELRKISAGVPQGSVLGPVLYLLYTRDIPKSEGTTMATFADDTAIMAVANTCDEATTKLQTSLDSVCRWTKLWRINLNETKSVQINFTNQRTNPIPLYVNDQLVPYANTAKYLGMTLDAKLRWKEHVKKKKSELELKYRKMYWLLGRNSELTIHNKLLLYKQILKPVWTYGIQLWGCTKKTNLEIIQRFQNKVLRGIVNAPWYIRNTDIHRDLKILTVEEEIQIHAQKHEMRLHKHTNVEVLELLDNSKTVRRLKRRKPLDLT